MVKLSRQFVLCALTLSLVAQPLGGTLFAAEEAGSAAVAAPSLRLPSPEALARVAIDSPKSVEVQRGYGYGYRRGRGRGAAAAAIMIGAAAAIGGTALLVYANRPECSTNPLASGCSYGTKVAGGSLLAGGVVGVAVGAALWR
jgi:hypothetical protein